MPGHRKRRQFKQTDAFTRGMVIGLKRAGWSIRQIAADTHLGASTVHRLWRRWLEQGNVTIYRNVGATRVTSARVDRRILRQAVAAPQATCTAILQHVQDTLDHSISTRTISRRLVANGLHSCRPLRRLPLTPPNRRQRLEWCRARSTWMTEWHRVVFSDESRFCLSSDSRRVRVWRRRGERSNPAAIVERPTVRKHGIMVWGAIAYDSRSPLLRIQGTMTAQRYVDDVLRPVTLPYLQGVPNALYQQDNARPHTARISQQALQDVQMLPWPPYSPDLSPIEHVWDIIGRRLHALPQPRSEDELWQMVEREWRAIPQDAIRNLIDSLPRRVAACIAVRGESPTEALRAFRNFKGIRRGKGPMSCYSLRRMIKNFEKTGSLEAKPRSGRPSTRKSVAVTVSQSVEAIETLSTYGEVSARQVSRQTGISYGTVWRALRIFLKKYPYKIQRFHELKVGDFEKRQEFAAWVFRQIDIDENWLSNVLWTDEAHFSLNGEVNTQNSRIWATENPRIFTEMPLHQPRVTVWCGFTSSFIIGPFFFEEINGRTFKTVSVTGERYVQLLREKVIPILQDRQALSEITFMQDGGPPHISRGAKQLLKDTFGEDRVISRHFIHQWPSRSPDLTPCDFWLWG
ncbi:hypothetical protein LAZ67_13000806, partial [Cordylochernes scorpioides]